MKFLFIFILSCLFVATLGSKDSPRRPGPPPRPRGPPSPPSGPQPPPRRPPSPPRRPQSPPRGPPPQKKTGDENIKQGWGSGSGWSGGSGSGWGGPPSYESTACVNPNSINVPNSDPNFFSNLRLWYTTGYTQYGLILNARILLGRYPLSQDELNQMCPAQVYSLTDANTYSFGYGLEYTINCPDSSTNLCTMSTDPSTYDGALGVDPYAGFVSQTVYLVATDNETYVIWYNCNDGAFAELQLQTTRPYASPAAVTAFLAAAQQYNIPLSQLQLPLCQTSFQGPYPPPFQNYPNGNGWSNSTGWSAPSNGWNQSPQPAGWSDPHPSGWNSSPPSGWSAPNGWGTGPQPVGWSSNNNGWGTPPHLDVKSEVKETESAKPKEKDESKQ